MPYAVTNGLKIYYEDEGKGRPLVFLPGLGGTTRLWFKQVPELKEHFRVICYDPRGAGRTDKPDGPYSMEMLAGDLNNLLNALEVDEPINLVGASYGGVVVQSFIHHYPERVRKLVLACTTLPYGDPYCIPIKDAVNQKVLSLNRISFEEKKELMSQCFFYPENVERHPDILNDLLQLGIGEQPDHARKAQVNAFYVPDSKYHQWLSQIKVPVLITQGHEDIIIQPENALNLKKLIGHSAELCCFKKAGHLFFMEHFESFNRKLLNFFKD